MVHRSESELSLDAILFERRNKQYGAYEIRSVYNRYLRTGLLLATAVFTLAILSPRIAEFLKAEEEVVEEFIMKEVILAEPPPIDPKITPPPLPPNIQAPAPPPAVKSTEFLPPKIMEDEKVVIEKEPPTQTELHNSNPGAVTQEGETENLNQLIVPGDGTGNQEVADVEKVLVFVGEPPVFQGDYEKFLKKNLRYPEKALDKKIQGKVHIKFVVEKDGSITDITLVRGLHPDCDQEAIRVVKLMDKKWSVGKNNGVPARVWKSLAIEFKVVTRD